MAFGLSRGFGKSPKGNKWVYYERLKTDSEYFNDPTKGNDPMMGDLLEKIYDRAVDVLKYRVTEGSDPEKIADYFRGLAQSESAKERKVLKEKFGTDLSKGFKTYNDEGAKKIIEAYNIFLKSKQIFERNLNTILNTEGDKGVYSFFGFYFEKAYQENLPQLKKRIRQLYLAGNTKEEAFKECLEEQLDFLIKETIYKMFSANAEDRSANNKEYNEAYKNIKDLLYDVNYQSQTNELIQGFKKIYFGDDKIIKEIASSYERPTKAKIDDIVSRKSQKSKQFFYTSGGFAMEYFEQWVTDVSHKVLSGAHEGNKGNMKSDFSLMTVGIKSTYLEEIEKESLGDRVKNVQAIKNSLKKIKNQKDDFIVYVSAKNYTLNKNFKGFSAGDPIKLSEWRNSIKVAGIDSDKLTFCIMQLIPGAIGNEKRNVEEDVSTMMARTIASALFDDFFEIGEKHNNKLNAIHLLDLDGVYIPLSFFFLKAAQAFDQARESSTKTIITTKIETPSSILYNDTGSYHEWKQTLPQGESAWILQREDAFKEIKIQYHFFKNFKKTLADLNIKL